jgi:hypothetical protein
MTFVKETGRSPVLRLFFASTLVHIYNLSEFRCSPTNELEPPRRRRLVSPSQWMRLSQRVPKRSTATLDSPSNAVAIASLRDKNQVTVLRQIHQRMIASVSDNAPVECMCPLQHQQLPGENIHPDSGALIANEIRWHTGANDEIAKEAVPVNLENHSSPASIKGSTPVTPIPMTHQSDWAEQQDDSLCFSLDSSAISNHDENRSRDRCAEPKVKSAAHGPPVLNVVDAEKAAPLRFEYHQADSSRDLERGLSLPAELNAARKEGSVGSSQFQQRLKALKQAGLIDLRMQSPTIVCGSSAIENEVKLMTHVDASLVNNKVEMNPRFTSEETVDRDQASIIGAHRTSHELTKQVLFNEAGSSFSQQSQQCDNHARNTPHATSTFASRPLEPKEVSPFIYPLTFLKHMFSPHSSCDHSEIDCSLIPGKVDDSRESETSNSFSFFSSPDSHCDATSSSGHRPHPSQRNRIKIQLSRRSGQPLPASTSSESQVVNVRVSPNLKEEEKEHVLNIIPSQSQSFSTAYDHAHARDRRSLVSTEHAAEHRLPSDEKGHGTARNMESAGRDALHGLDTISCVLSTRPSPGETSAARMYSPSMLDCTRPGPESSPANVEEALWEEFEQQPSIQLLHSIRKDLRSQLASIISKLEQSLVDSSGLGERVDEADTGAAAGTRAQPLAARAPALSRLMASDAPAPVRCEQRAARARTGEPASEGCARTYEDGVCRGEGAAAAGSLADTPGWDNLEAQEDSTVEEQCTECPNDQSVAYGAVSFSKPRRHFDSIPIPPHAPRASPALRHETQDAGSARAGACGAHGVPGSRAGPAPWSGKGSKAPPGERAGWTAVHDKENLINAVSLGGPDASGCRPGSSKVAGQALMRLAVREKDLWC